MLLRRLLLSAFVFLAAPLAARASQVAFSEVMYQPLAGKPEFLEVVNLSATPLDMARWQFTEGVAFTFPDFNASQNQAHFLKPYERIILSAADETATRTAYPGIPLGTRIFGPWTGALDNNGERITLQDKNGVIVATLEYGDSGKWPVQADGTGHSLVLADANRMPDDWRVWRGSTSRNGSPGADDPAPPAAGMALNEFHFDPATGIVDWVELRNNSRSAAASATGLFVATKADFTDKVALSGTVAAGAVISVGVSFAPESDGDLRLYLVDASNNVRDAVKVRRIAGRDTWQQFPAASGEWYSATADTRNAQNNPARNGDVVINEIMADPPSNQRDAEFIELHNRSTAAVNIGGWKLDDAVDFAFPPGTTIPAGGYLVVAANAAHLNAANPGVSALGDWSGSLANGGERIRLEDANGNLVDQVDYRFGGEWPELAGGNGSSLELIHPSADNSLGTAWADSNEAGKSAFASYAVNLGTYADTPFGSTNDDELRLWLVGDGHLVLRNIVLRRTTGDASNVLANAGSMTANPGGALTAIDGWQARGTHWQSFADAEGVHLIATGHGDNKCNHMEKDASSASGTAGLVSGVGYTLTFEARWVYGKPRIVAQSWDCSIGGVALVPIPANLGTPGAANSRLQANPPPQVTAITHAPATPPTGSTVTVTTRVSSAIGVGSATLFHRLDNATNGNPWNSTSMNDSGAGADAIAGDGIYSASVPLASFSGLNSAGSTVSYNTAGSIVQFYVRVTAANGLSTDLPKGGAATPALWVCDNQSPATDLRRMRVVIGAYWANALSQESSNPNGGHTATYNYKFPTLSNQYFPCTFIHNDSEVFHGSFVRKTGSPFTRSPSNVLDRARVVLPGDRDFRDKGKLYWDNDSGNAMLNNRIARYFLYLLGVPGNENEVCRVARNNGAYTVRETNEAFDKDMVDRIWPDGSDGLWWEMDDQFVITDLAVRDNAAGINPILSSTNATFDYKSGNSQGTENPTAYHNQFVPKTREWEYNFTPLISLFKQLEQNTSITPEQLERMVDVKAMAAYAAVRGYIADWDNITMSRGKNGFFYQRSTDRRFLWMHWDSDNTFQANRVDDAVIGTLTNVGTTAPGFFSKPYVRRWANYYLNQMITTYAINGPRLAAWIAAEAAASPSYDPPTTWANWPNVVDTDGNTSNQTRHQRIQAFIGTTSLSAAFGVATPANGASYSINAIDATGSAPINAASVACIGHPEAVFSWVPTDVNDVSPWRLAGIRLTGGANTLVFRAFDENGAQLGSDITRTVNRTGNAPPAGVLAVNPASQNVALGQPVTLDAGASTDPENAGPLSFTWSVTPSSGFTTTVLGNAARQLVFSVPGSYIVTVQITDAASQVSSVSRALSVFNAADRDDFGGDYLSGYAIQNLELRDNSSPGAWYSLNETPGSLVIGISDRAALPLNAGEPAFPLITRPVPSSADFYLQTNLSYTNPQLSATYTSGSVSSTGYLAGLYLETLESGTVTRYAFGLDGGVAIRVYRASGAASYLQAGSSGYAGEEVVLRVQRTSTALNFQQRVSGLWLTVHSRTLPAGSTVVRAGIFSSTAAAQNQIAAFDYLLAGDPGNSTNLVDNLRITELMYHPAGAGGVEFIELTNTGNAPLQLQGAYFDDGFPFDRFTFGALTLQPGAFVVVTNDVPAFQALYGTGPTVAGQFTGNISNGGERIVLRDGDGNLVQDFTFDDDPALGWPAAADGAGFSLIALATAGSYQAPLNWAASNEPGGTPGAAGTDPDTDRDGQSDRAELLAGTHPRDPASSFRIVALARDDSGRAVLTWPSVAGRSYRVEYRDGLGGGAWLLLATVPGAAGAQATSYADPASAAAPARFYRIVTTSP